MREPLSRRRGSPASLTTSVRNASVTCVWVALFALACHASGRACADERSISTSERVAIDGAELFLLTRGEDRSAPVVVWLHGGPGAAERPLFRYFNGALEDHFVVAYLDQRGAGRSFDPNVDPSQLTVARHLVDLDAVVSHLRRELGTQKVTLIGHSWGGALGLLYAHSHSDKVSAVVAVSPLVSTRVQQRAQYDFVYEEASRRKQEDVLAELRDIGAPPHGSAANVLAMERLAGRYGAVFHEEPSRMWILLRGVVAGLVTPWEIPRLIRGNQVSLEAMNDELIDLDLTKSVPELGVPVIFMLGRHDHHVSAEVASSYFEALRAPSKKVIWFEDSAHNVPFEQPERFNTSVQSELEAIGVDDARSRDHRNAAIRCPRRCRRTSNSSARLTLAAVSRHTVSAGSGPVSAVSSR